MGVLMEGFMRNAQGGISIRRFDADQFPGPSQGWYDSPSKVPPLPGQELPEAPADHEPVKVSQAEAQISANLGTFDKRRAAGAADPVVTKPRRGRPPKERR
jgi:hypothetical protein